MWKTPHVFYNSWHKLLQSVRHIVCGAAFGRVALGSHGVEWTCDLQFQFYKRWFSIERNMSQQTLIIVISILLVDIFVNEALAVFSRQVPGDYIWSVHRLSVIHALGNYEQSTSASDLYWDRLNWCRLINIAITKRWQNVCDHWSTDVYEYRLLS